MKKKVRLIFIICLTFLFPVAAMFIISSCGGNKEFTRPEGPCDIYTSSGFPCVTAHSTTRALYSSYNGPLYQVTRESDGKTLDIGVVQPAQGNAGGYADASAQDEFCANTVCWISAVYDQSGNGNHLYQAPPGTFRGPAKGGFNTLPIADMAPITIMGHKAYGVFVMPGTGLRNNNANGLARNDEPQGIYMVFDGTHFDHGCCFNYGNTSTNSRAVGRGTMETVYFGTATAWGKGVGSGPWIMSDMEAGLFSGYSAKQNDGDPSMDSLLFVSGFVSGGGGNHWEIHGGNAQQGGLTTFYNGKRPHSNENDWYYPMHRKGGIQLGNGGDNGNGSSGTFYEGVVTTGYPDSATLDAVQKNIVSVKYDVQRLNLSRLTTFTPGMSQEATVTFTNTTGSNVSNVTISISAPTGWSAVETASGDSLIKIRKRLAAGESVNVTYKITSPENTGAGYLTAKAEWKGNSENIAQRVRNVYPVKINEVRLSGGSNPNDQFIELFNPSDNEIDISGWSLINTKSEWAPVSLATIPSGTKIAAKGFYLLGLAADGLASPANKGENNILVLNTENLRAGQQVVIGGETRTIKKVGTPASPMTIVFVPVSTGPWYNIPAGSTNIPVVSADGFKVGEKIGIDLGGNYEVATVTSVGKAATLTNLVVESKAGDTVIKVSANSGILAGDTLIIGTGLHKEIVEVKRIVSLAVAPSFGGPNPGSAGRSGDIELVSPLKFDHSLAEDVSDRGTGSSFSPATRFVHRSGDAVQALGNGVVLDKALEMDHEYGTAIINPAAKTAGYQGSVAPNQWYGSQLSSAAGSLALMDNSGSVVVDAMVYGSLQSNSGANGTVTNPEIATLEGNQSQSGCIVVVPGAGRNYGPVASSSDKSVGRFPDDNDTDNNCSDFLLQNSTTLTIAPKAGSNNLKVSSVNDFTAGKNIVIGTGKNAETVMISEVGTAGGTFTASSVKPGSAAIPVSGVEGFAAGQTITIESGAKSESVTVASTVASRRRPGTPVVPDTIKVSTPLKNAYNTGTLVSGSGITLSSNLTKAHEKGDQVAGNVPTPGEANRF
jgi:hypothetical protein